MGNPQYPATTAELACAMCGCWMCGYISSFWCATCAVGPLCPMCMNAHDDAEHQGKTCCPYCNGTGQIPYELTTAGNALEYDAVRLGG